MGRLIVLINLFFVPLLPLYLIYTEKKKRFELNLDLVFQYGIIAACNIPLTKVFTVTVGGIIGTNIGMDTGVYTVAAVLPTVLAVLLYRFLPARWKEKIAQNGMNGAVEDISPVYILGRDSGSGERMAQRIISALAAHPYLWALGVCLLLNPFFFGAEEYIPNNVPWLGTIVVIGAAAAFALYKYKAGKLDGTGLVLFFVSAIIADGIAARFYSQSQNKAVWHFIGGCAIIVILFSVLYRSAGFKKYRPQLISLMILGLGFCLKLHYVLVTSLDVRQHDVSVFGGNDGHTGYIEYFLFNHKLPDFDLRSVWQFHHPPLHHIISAIWIYINEKIMLIGYDAARTSLQMLTLFYSMCIMIAAYRILRYFKLKGLALYIPLTIISFHPSFILLAGSINNDVLSVAFIMGAVVSTLKWYEEQTTKEIMKIALCVGLGMMTKVSAAIVAPPIAVVFLIVFIRKFKTDGKKLMGQFVCFGLVCIPLGLWFEIRSYIKWGIPFTYVPALGENTDQYLGNQSFLSRATDFSSYQLSRVYEQWEWHGSDYFEFNPLIALMKNSIFGEYIHEDSFIWAFVNTVSVFFFWINVAIAAFALIAMIVMCFRKASIHRTEMLFFAGFYALMIVSFYKMSADYPHTCTMNFRYITPAAIVGALFIGLFLAGISNQNRLFDKVIRAGLAGGTFSFAACSVLVYLALV